MTTSAGVNEPALRVLVVAQSVARAATLEDGLHAAGCTEVTVVHELQHLMRRIVATDPDVLCIDLGSPTREALEQLFQVARSVLRPIALFVDRADTETIAAAVDAGVGAFVVDGLRKERVKAIVDTAIIRFNAHNKLREELENAKQALEDRKVIERAKGILMKQQGMSEQEAYSLLRKTAMNENRRLGEVAQSVVTTASMFK
jgi:response regulator NasT